MEFDRDRAKARAILRKHGVSFAEAASVFGDVLAVTFTDPDHSQAEERWLTFGLSEQQRLLVVAHTERDGRVRIISARKATKNERNVYQQG